MKVEVGKRREEEAGLSGSDQHAVAHAELADRELHVQSSLKTRLDRRRNQRADGP